MKKLITLTLILIVVLGIVACESDETEDIMELENVCDSVCERGYTAKDFEEKLLGKSNEDIIQSWGEADVELSGFWGHLWYLDDKKEKYIALYYDENGYVEDIIITEE